MEFSVASLKMSTFAAGKLTICTFQVEAPIGRVVYRGNNNANALCDASHSNTYVGSRLAFRGKIVVAESVAAYKAAVEVA